MNQTLYSSFLFYILGVIIFSTPIYPKLLKPSMNGENKEILLVKSKRRLYYPIKNEELRYIIEGPTRLEFISRYPALKKKGDKHSYNYLIVLDREDTVKVNHRYKIQKTIRSVQHPKHSYTYSGNYFINLGKGTHNIELFQDDNLQYPVLIRVLAKEFKSLGKDKEILMPMVYQRSVKLVSKNNKIDYFECTRKLPLQIEVNGKKTLRIMSRLEFSDSMGQEDAYRLRVKEGNKIIGTYYFNSKRSSESSILGKDDKVPGIWRSCDIAVQKGKHTYSIEVADEGKTILTRFILY